MIHIKLKDKLHIQIDTEDRRILNAIRDHFSAYVEGARFMPQYGNGWNGKVYVFHTPSRSLGIGLITELLRFLKKDYPNEPLSISPEVSQLFCCIENPQITQKLKYEPREYQLDCILVALKYGKCIIKSSVASGKSLIIGYILNELFLAKKIKRALILTPTINLVEQFYSDLINYNFDQKRLGRLYEKQKEIDKEILISTWQSLKNRPELLPLFDCIIGDEAHCDKSKEIQKILSNTINASVRMGFTGTLPIPKLDMWNIQSYLGPVIREYTSSELAKLGYVAKCTINTISIKYVKKYTGEYSDIKDNVFANEYRLGLIRHILNKANSNVLMLVGKIEKEGKLLQEYLTTTGVNKEVVFIWGNTKVDEREHWRAELEQRKDIALIATYPIFSMGVNIPSLKYIILASPFKSNIRVLQSIGRSLRTHVDKVDGAQVWDLIDLVKYLNKHGNSRTKYYIREGFDIVDVNLFEKYGKFE